MVLSFHLFSPILCRQAEVAETAQAIAEASGPLLELASLLPSAALPFVSGPVSLSGHSEARRRAGEASAGRDAWLWSQQEDGGGDGQGKPGESEGVGLGLEGSLDDWREVGGMSVLLGVDLEALSAALVQTAGLAPSQVGGGGGAAVARRTASVQAVKEALDRYHTRIVTST